MTAQIIPFKIESNEIRVAADDQGEPWFVAADVCAVLGYKNAPDAIAKHCREAGIAKRDISSGGQMREVLMINEGNLYRLIIKCRLPVAERLEALVCDEILPAIRKHGAYVHTITPAQQLQLRRAVAKIARKPEEFKAVYHKLHDEFQISEYKQLPSKQIDAALEFIASLDGEYLPKPEPVNALHELPQADIFGTFKALLSKHADGTTTITMIGPDCIAFPPDKLPDLIANGNGQIPKALLPKIIEAVAKRMTGA